MIVYIFTFLAGLMIVGYDMMIEERRILALLSAGMLLFSAKSICDRARKAKLVYEHSFLFLLGSVFSWVFAFFLTTPSEPGPVVTFYAFGVCLLGLFYWAMCYLIKRSWQEGEDEAKYLRLYFASAVASVTTGIVYIWYIFPMIPIQTLSLRYSPTLLITVIAGIAMTLSGAYYLLFHFVKKGEKDE